MTNSTTVYGPLRSEFSAWDTVLVTPSNTADLPNGPCQGLLISAAGVVKIDTPGGSTVSPALQAGISSIGAKRVYATGTDAVTIWALYLRQPG